MTSQEFAAVVGFASLAGMWGALVGSALVQLFPRRSKPRGRSEGDDLADGLDPAQDRRVAEGCRYWSEQHGVPGFAPFAEGYVRDALRDARRAQR